MCSVPLRLESGARAQIVLLTKVWSPAAPRNLQKYARKLFKESLLHGTQLSSDIMLQSGTQGIVGCCELSESRSRPKWVVAILIGGGESRPTRGTPL